MLIGFQRSDYEIPRLKGPLLKMKQRTDKKCLNSVIHTKRSYKSMGRTELARSQFGKSDNVQQNIVKSLNTKPTSIYQLSKLPKKQSQQYFQPKTKSPNNPSRPEAVKSVTRGRLLYKGLQKENGGLVSPQSLRNTSKRSIYSKNSLNKVSTSQPLKRLASTYLKKSLQSQALKSYFTEMRIPSPLNSEYQQTLSGLENNQKNKLPSLYDKRPQETDESTPSSIGSNAAWLTKKSKYPSKSFRRVSSYRTHLTPRGVIGSTLNEQGRVASTLSQQSNKNNKIPSFSDYINKYYETDGKHQQHIENRDTECGAETHPSKIKDTKRRYSQQVQQGDAIPEEQNSIMGLESYHTDNQIDAPMKQLSTRNFQPINISRSRQNPILRSYKDCTENTPLGNEQLSDKYTEEFVDTENCILTNSLQPTPLHKRISRINSMKSDISNQCSVQNIIKKIQVHLAILGLIPEYINNPNGCIQSNNYEQLSAALNRFYYHQKVQTEMALMGNGHSCFRLKDIEISDQQLSPFLGSPQLQKLIRGICMQNDIVQHIDSVVNMRSSLSSGGFDRCMQLLIEEFNYLEDNLLDCGSQNELTIVMERIVETMLIAFLYKQLTLMVVNSQCFSQSSATSLQYRIFTSRWQQQFEAVNVED